MLSRQSRPDGSLANSYARLATWQGEVSSGQAVERQGALLVALYGARQAQQEAEARASAARAYSNLLCADFWERVAVQIGPGCPIRDRQSH